MRYEIATTWLVLSAALGLGCRSSERQLEAIDSAHAASAGGSGADTSETVRAANDVAAVADASASNATQGRERLVARLRAMVLKRREELNAKHPDNSALYAQCAAPDPSLSASVTSVVEAWIKGQRLGRVDDTSIDVLCQDRARLLVRASAEVHAHVLGTQFTWVLRVNGAKVQRLAGVHGSIPGELMVGWTGQRSLQVIDIVDLEHDGILDPIMMEITTLESDGDGGGHFRVFTSIHGAKTEVGAVFGQVGLARLQPAPEAGVLVFDIRERGERNERRFPCLSGPGAWAECPAGEAAKRFAESVDAGDWLAEAADMLSSDRDALAEALGRFGGVSAAELAELLALATPASAKDAIARFLDRRQREPAPESTGMTTAIHAALALHECPALEATAKKHAERSVRAWVTKNEARVLVELSRLGEEPLPEGEAPDNADVKASRYKAARPTELSVTASCVGPAGTYWLAQWNEKIDGHEGHYGRSTLFFSASGHLVPLVSSMIALVDDGAGAGQMHRPTEPLEVSFYAHENAIGALVRRAHFFEHALEDLVAVVDDKVTGTHVGQAELHWRSFERGVENLHRPSGLARSIDDARRITFWRATAHGVEPLATIDPKADPATAAHDDKVTELLRMSERATAAYALLSDLQPNDLARIGEVVGALQALGADDALVARVRGQAAVGIPEPTAPHRDIDDHE